MIFGKFEALKNAGTDIEGTLVRFCQNENMYIEFLKIFIVNENSQKLDIAFNNKNMNDIISEAHTLKGVSGNLGLNPLFELYSNIVLSGRANDFNTIEKLMTQLHSKYKEFEDIIKRL